MTGDDGVVASVRVLARVSRYRCQHPAQPSPL